MPKLYAGGGGISRVTSIRYRPRWDSEYDGDEAPHVVGRRRLGRISIANSDAGASAIMGAAINQAHRAIAEIDSS